MVAFTIEGVSLQETNDRVDLELEKREILRMVHVYCWTILILMRCSTISCDEKVRASIVLYWANTWLPETFVVGNEQIWI